MDDKKDASVKRMAQLLQQGATMLADGCPQCGSPLLKVEDDIYCAMCDRRIVYASSEEEVESFTVKELLPELKDTLLLKLKTLNDLIERENDTETLTKLANLMVLLLQALDSLRKMNK
ncbi:MAG: Sjogren's syndrome/scleroderma autoantigen 1 family protein [Candidatus Thorarchaeota archaeon]